MTTQSTGTLKDLLEQAGTAEEQARAAQANLNVVLDRLQAARGGAVALPPAEPTTAPRRGRPPGKGTKKKVAKKNAASKEAPPKKRTAKKKAGGAASGKVSLEKAIFLALDRNEWPMLPDLSAEAVKECALNVSEIYQVIVHDELWVSKKNKKFTNQISTELQKLRHKGKVYRIEGLRYYVVQGATYDGPYLDEDGNPVKE